MKKEKQSEKKNPIYFNGTVFTNHFTSNEEEKKSIIRHQSSYSSDSSDSLNHHENLDKSLEKNDKISQ